MSAAQGGLGGFGADLPRLVPGHDLRHHKLLAELELLGNGVGGGAVVSRDHPGRDAHQVELLEHGNALRSRGVRDPKDGSHLTNTTTRGTRGAQEGLRP